MIRKSTINLKYVNPGKLKKIRSFLSSYTTCVNQFIDLLWSIQRFKGTFVERALLDQIETILFFTAKQSAAQMALHMVKSQRKKHRKTKPHFLGKSFELDQRFICFPEISNSFDCWVRLRRIGLGKAIYLPSRKHKQFLKFSNAGWTLKNCGRLRVKDDGLYLDVFFHKASPILKVNGDIVGLDIGYKKLAVLSDGQVVGKELENKIAKIARKKQGSKAFKKALRERDDYINHEVKNIDLSNIKTLVVEDLKNVKHKSKGKIRKEFNNKLQRWTYPYLLNRLEQTCGVVGVQYHKVNPAYTSQTCANCGDIHKENRVGEVFKCVACGHIADADANASKNILNRFLQQECSDPVGKSYA